jgi:hypothetical protein
MASHGKAQRGWKARAHALWESKERFLLLGLRRRQMRPVGLSIALISLPCASHRYPSLALSTLKPILQREGHQVAVRYYNVLFSQLIGQELYDKLTKDQQHNLGEQAFSHLIYPNRDSDEQFRNFIAEVASREFFTKLRKAAERLVEIAATELLELRPNAIGFTTTFYQKMASVAVSRAGRSCIWIGYGKAGRPVGVTLS